MGKTLNERLKRLPNDRRENILAKAHRLQMEYLKLQKLQKAKELTKRA